MNQLSHLLSQPWLLHDRSAATLYTQYLRGSFNIQQAQENRLATLKAMPVGFIGQPMGTYAPSFLVKQPGGNVAVMNVLGMLTKRGDMCSYGMQNYMAEIAELNRN